MPYATWLLLAATVKELTTEESYYATLEGYDAANADKVKPTAVDQAAHDLTQLLPKPRPSVAMLVECMKLKKQQLQAACAEMEKKAADDGLQLLDANFLLGGISPDGAKVSQLKLYFARLADSMGGITLDHLRTVSGQDELF